MTEENNNSTNLEDKTKTGNELVKMSGQNSIVQGVMNYTQVQTQRNTIAKNVEKLEKTIDSQVEKAGKDMYKGQNPFAIIYKGAKNKNIMQVKNGFKKMVGAEISVVDMLKSSYKDFVKSKEDIKDKLEEAEQDLSNTYTLLEDNATQRKTLSETKKALTKEIQDLNNKINDADTKRAAISPLANNYDALTAELDLEKTHNSRILTEKTLELQGLSGQLDAMRETYDFTMMSCQEHAARLPHIKTMYIQADSKVLQMDLLIQSQTKSIETAESLFNVAKTYETVRKVLEVTNEISTQFNNHIHELKGYIQRPLIDEAGLSRRVNSISNMKIENDKEFKMLTMGSEDKSLELTMSECYETLNLDMTATKEDIEAAKKNLLQKYHPDKAFGDVEREQIYRTETEKIMNAATFLKTFKDLDTKGSSRKLLS